MREPDIPELPPAVSQEATDGPETVPEGSGGGGVPPDSREDSGQRSWLYRFFFGP